MKKLTKLIFSCAAVAAVTAALGTAALAETVDVTGDFTGTYDTETGALVLNYESTDADQTILVLNKDGDNVAEDDIVHVDQQNKEEKGDIAGATLATAKVTDAISTTYTIKIGGTNGDIKKATFKLPGGAEGVQVLMGDVDDEEGVDISDAVTTLRHASELITLEGAKLFAADVDGEEGVDIADSVCILRYASELSSGYGVTGEYKTYIAE